MPNPRHTVCLDVLSDAIRDGTRSVWTKNPKKTRTEYLNRLSALRVRMREGTLKHPRAICVVLASQDLEIKANTDSITIQRINK